MPVVVLVNQNEDFPVGIRQFTDQSVHSVAEVSLAGDGFLDAFGKMLAAVLDEAVGSVVVVWDAEGQALAEAARAQEHLVGQCLEKRDAPMCCPHSSRCAASFPRSRLYRMVSSLSLRSLFYLKYN